MIDLSTALTGVAPYQCTLGDPPLVIVSDCLLASWMAVCNASLVCEEMPQIANQEFSGM